MIGLSTPPVRIPSLVGLESVAQDLVDAEEARDGFDLHGQCRRAEHDGVAARHVGTNQLAHLRIDPRHNVLNEQPLAELVDVVERASAHHRCAAVDELLEIRAAELVVQRGLHDAEELANTNLAAAHPVLRHDHAGESGDQGAVEIEERADFRAVRARVDLGHRAGQPDVAAIERPVGGGAHDGALPLGDDWLVARGRVGEGRRRRAALTAER